MSEGLQSIPPDEENKKAEEIVNKLTQVDPKLFEGISKEKKNRIIHSLAVIQKTHIGPLPDPETFSQYAQLIPNGADRIMIMAERQSEHRMQMEKKVIGGQLLQSNIGQFLAFLIGLAAIGGGVYCVTTGHEIGGSILGVGGLTGLVTAFIQGRKRQTINLAQKQVQPIK